MTVLRSSCSVALATCARLPLLDDGEDRVIAPLAELGVEARPEVWDDPSVRWDAYDLVVVRTTWDYAPRREAFLAWARSVPRLMNPPDVLAWNTDKAYLDVLGRERGLPVVPTLWVRPGDEPVLPESGEYVVKPSVSAKSRNTGRYDLGDREHRDLAAAHLRSLLDAGRTAMVQPYLTDLDTHGETSLVFFRGAFSHAARRPPMLTGPADLDEGIATLDRILPRQASETELALGRRVMAALPGGGERYLYARVDMAPGEDGLPVLMEVELTEPGLLLRHDDKAAPRFAEAIHRTVADLRR